MSSEIEPDGVKLSSPAEFAEDSITDSETILSIRNLTTGYTDVPFISDLSISLSSGEIVALLGANGSGKTTILKAILGLLPAWSGQVMLQDHDLIRYKVHERVKMGLVMVPAGRLLFSGMTVEDNLKMGGYLNWKPQVLRERMGDVFDLFPEIEKRKYALSGKLSGGEQQMVSLGRALMTRPRVLFIDELSLGLAPVVAERLLSAIETIHTRLNIPIMFVEQDVVRALEIADRAYVLDQGKIAMQGKPKMIAEDRNIIQAYMGI